MKFTFIIIRELFDLVQVTKYPNGNVTILADVTISGNDKALNNNLVLANSNVEQRPLWDRVEKLQPRPGSGSSSGSNSSSQASPGDRFRPRCESPGTELEYIF